MKSRLLYILISIFILSCNDNKSNVTKPIDVQVDSKLNNDHYFSENGLPISHFSKKIQEEIFTYNKLQDSIDVECINNQYKMTDKDIEIGAKIVYECLIKNQFKPISNTEYNKILTEVFKFDSEVKIFNLIRRPNYFIYLLGWDENDKGKLSEIAYDYTYDHIFFLTNYNIISDLPLIGDYVENPHYENTVSDKTRFYIPDKLIHRNKYLFNASQSSLTWLINNDLDFLEILLKEFGYDKEPTINKVILNKVSETYSSKQPTQREDLINLFARRNHLGKLQIREGLMQFVLDNTTTENYKYLDLLESFASTLNGPRKIDESFTEQERFEILAYISYYVQKAYDLHWEKYSRDWPAVSILYRILSFEDETSRKFLQQIKENNYYGLEGFEKMVNDMLQYIEDEPPLSFF